MIRVRVMTVALALFAALSLSGDRARAQMTDPAVIEAQKEAMKKLAMLDGAWRGTAWTLLPSGEKKELTQTERVGPFLDGVVRVIEGRGYEADGKVGFNAFATISYDATKKTYTMHSYAHGRVGDFILTPTADGFIWEVPMGPITIRYTATVKNGEWHEVGERSAKGQASVRFFEMTLKRLGDSDWPAGGAIPPK